MWFLITMPIPIFEEEANRAASTLINTVPSGGGVKTNGAQTWRTHTCG
jgi:hypothetical protein